MNKEEIQRIIKSDVPMIDKKVAIKLYSEISDNYINNNKIYKSRNSKFFLLSYSLSRIQKTIKETDIPEKTLKVIKDKLLLLESLIYNMPADQIERGSEIFEIITYIEGALGLPITFPENIDRVLEKIMSKEELKEWKK